MCERRNGGPSRRFVPFIIATAALAAPGAVLTPPLAPRPTVTYTLRLDPLHLDQADVAIRFRDAAPVFRLAMKVHAEYGARYWRYLSDMGIDSSADDVHATVQREDSALWLVTMPGGHGVIHYRIHIQPPAAAARAAWRLYARADGALINPPDVFLYAPAFADIPVHVQLDVPPTWRIATALGTAGTSVTRTAPDAAALLDAPILMGALRQWSFAVRGTTYRVTYWPLPDAVSFDTAAFVAGLHALARVTSDMFGGAPVPDYDFLIEDGAFGALEHGASVTIGVASTDLARDPHASVTEIAHEFFHTWNLVAIRPTGYNDLSYRPPTRTPSLWLGEGVTMYYADALPRRAGLVDSTPSRLAHLGELLERYYASPNMLQVSPARASLAFGDTPLTNADATGGYYLQGELLAGALDALIRDSTGDLRGLDDVMRTLYDRSHTAGYRGYGPGEVRTAIDAVCRCNLSRFLDAHVDSARLIDVAPVLARLGLALVVDSATATDSAGRPLPDLRVYTNLSTPPGVLRLVITDRAAAWAAAGLRTGDELLALNGAPLPNRQALQAQLDRLRIGDTAVVAARRTGVTIEVRVPIESYRTPRVRFVDAARVTPVELARRQQWMAGL